MQHDATITRSRRPLRWRRRTPGRGPALLAALVLALGLAACGADDDDAAMTITSDADGITSVDGEPTDDGGAADDADASADDAGDAAADASADTSPTGLQIPAAMPAAIPIPDDHVLLRSEDANYDHSGDIIGVNFATSGTVDERREYYRSALEQAYGEVELVEADGMVGEYFRFQGDWFELGEVHVGENEGFADNDTIDTSDLPVFVYISLSEIDDTSD